MQIALLSLLLFQTQDRIPLADFMESAGNRIATIRDREALDAKLKELAERPVVYRLPAIVWTDGLTEFLVLRPDKKRLTRNLGGKELQVHLPETADYPRLDRYRLGQRLLVTVILREIAIEYTSSPVRREFLLVEFSAETVDVVRVEGR